MPRSKWIRACMLLILATVMTVTAPLAAAEPAAIEPAYLPDQWNLKITQTVQAWGLARGSRDHIIGVIDSGVDPRHAEFTDKIVKGRNTANDSDDTTDRNGHGTFVAGVAAARGDKMLGVAPQTRVMALKIREGGGVFYADTDYGEPIAKALRHGARNGVRIFNISLGSTISSAQMRQAVEEVWASGGLIFVSAGNTGQDWTDGEPSPRYPASYKQAIAVAATTRQDRAAGYSLPGPHVRLSAPGGDSNGSSGSANARAELILGPMPGRTGYDWSEGTSFAAPHAAGLASLVWAVNPSLTNEQVAEILFNTSDRPGNFNGRNNFFGYGRINSFRAVLAALPDPFAVSLDRPLLDRINGSGTLEIAGWAANVRAETAGVAQSVRVYLGADPETGQLLGEATLGQPSSDLAKVTNNPVLLEAGYVLRVDASTLPAGPQTLTVVARAADGSTARRSLAIEVSR